MIIFGRFEKLFDFLGQICAFLTVGLIGVLYINQIVPVPFIGADSLSNLLVIKEYAVLATLIICGLEFACKRSIIVFALFCVCAVAAVALSFPALFS